MIISFSAIDHQKLDNAVRIGKPKIHSNTDTFHEITKVANISQSVVTSRHSYVRGDYGMPLILQVTGDLAR